MTAFAGALQSPLTNEAAGKTGAGKDRGASK